MNSNEARLKIYEKIVDILVDLASDEEEDTDSIREGLSLIADTIFEELDLVVVDVKDDYVSLSVKI
jgi:hypothetical protein